MVCNPFCCTSIPRGSKRLAVIDIILFFITVVVSTGLEWGIYSSIPMRFVLFDDGTQYDVSQGSGSTETIFMEEESKPSNSNGQHIAGKAIWIHVSQVMKDASELSPLLGYTMYLGMLILMMSYFILEIWLCCILIRAATENRPEFCKRWLLYRIPLLILTLAMTVINLAQMQYTVTDIVIQPLNILRLYSIFAVIQLRKKLLKMDPKFTF